MNDPRTLVWADCETTKLGPGRMPWEIALIRRPAGADVRGDTSYLWMVDLRDLDLGNADPIALRIGGFYERHPQMSRDPEIRTATRLPEVLRKVENLTRGAVVLGSNPAFDTEALDPLMRVCGILPSWHYHPVDLPSMCEGFLRGRGLPLPAKLKSDELARAVGVDPDRYKRHTALGDCELFRAVYDAMAAPAPGKVADIPTECDTEDTSGETDHHETG
jgi:DNA polymerase III epsilon subunit-like protein